MNPLDQVPDEWWVLWCRTTHDLVRHDKPANIKHWPLWMLLGAYPGRVWTGRELKDQLHWKLEWVFDGLRRWMDLGILTIHNHDTDSDDSDEGFRVRADDRFSVHPHEWPTADEHPGLTVLEGGKQ